MLQLHAGAVWSFGDERDFDLAGVVRVGLDLPPWADVPAEHDAAGCFVGQDARPATFAAIDAPIVDVTSDLRFEHGLRDWHAQRVVLWRLEITEPRVHCGNQPGRRSAHPRPHAPAGPAAEAAIAAIIWQATTVDASLLKASGHAATPTELPTVAELRNLGFSDSGSWSALASVVSSNLACGLRFGWPLAAQLGAIAPLSMRG